MKLLSESTWKEVCIGYGIQKVPADLARDLGCVDCGQKGHLYTTSRLTPREATTKAYNRMMADLAQNVHCKNHAYLRYA